MIKQSGGFDTCQRGEIEVKVKVSLTKGQRKDDDVFCDRKGWVQAFATSCYQRTLKWFLIKQKLDSLIGCDMNWKYVSRK